MEHSGIVKIMALNILNAVFLETFKLILLYLTRLADKKEYTVRAPCIFLTPIFSAIYVDCRAVDITDNLCPKQGNSSIFKPKILFEIKSGLK